MADEISFICKRTVVSTTPIEPQKLITLSPLDRIMENHHLRIVFYYKFPARRSPGEITKKLRESMAEMLSDFPVVTGRLVRAPNGHWMIKCNDAGVRMVEARVKGSVEEWLKNVDREKEMKLVYWEDVFHKPYFWSPFYVQITEFENGGLAIGLSCTHMLSDPICATMMIKAWADTTLRGKIGNPPLFIPLPFSTQRNINTNNHLIHLYKTAFEESLLLSNKKHTTITLHFNQEKVKSCIAMAETPKAHNDHKTGPTPFEALIGLFWVCISKIKGPKTGLVDISICLDMRKKLGLGKAFFGNCMVHKRVHGDDNNVSNAAALIKKTVSKIDGDELTGLIGWLEKENCEKSPIVNGSDLICVNLEDVEAYQVVFEENVGPLRVSYYIEPAVGPGRIIVLPAPGGHGPYGRVVAITLPKDEVEKLLEDALIRRIMPNTLMGLNKVS